MLASVRERVEAEDLTPLREVDEVQCPDFFHLLHVVEHVHRLAALAAEARIVPQEGETLLSAEELPPHFNDQIHLMY